MTARQYSALRLGAAALLSLALTACTQPVTLPGTPVTSLADSGPGSLRDALAGAGPADTLRLTGSGTVHLSAPLQVSQTVTILAEGVILDAGGQGRALEVVRGGRLVLRGGTLRGGVGRPLPATLSVVARPEAASQRPQALRPLAELAPTYGGLILNAGSLTLDGVTVTGGQATLGGGVANLTGGTLTVNDATEISGNTVTGLGRDYADEAGLGGGIYNAGTLQVAGGRISRNTSDWGGTGIFNAEGATLTMTGGHVDDNTCVMPVETINAVTTGCVGGGIYANGDVTISGGSVSHNVAAYFGAGITLQRATQTARPTLTISGGTIADNVTSDFQDASDGASDGAGGGGIWQDGRLIMTGGTVRGNHSVYGGGLCSAGDTQISGGLFESNTATSGGGLFVYARQGRETTNTLGGSLSVKGNTATETGGGATFAGTSVNTLSGGAVTGNTVTGDRDGGGGVRIYSAAALTMSGGEITLNAADKTGGGVVVGGHFTLTGGRIAGNTVTRTVGSGGGGGVRLYAGSVMTASGGEISGNTAQYGGGLKTDQTYRTSVSSILTLDGTTVSGNQALGSSGGGLYNDGGVLMRGGSITGNTAAQRGGGVFNSGFSLFGQSGGRVTGNAPDDVTQE
jgi:hypothetical protein